MAYADLIYDVNDPSEQAYLLKQGTLIYSIEQEQFEFCGSNMMFGVSELLLERAYDRPFTRQLQVLEGESCEYRKVPKEHVLKYAKSFNIGWTIAQNMAHVITSCQQIFTEKNHQLSTNQKLIKGLSIVFAKNVNLLQRFVDHNHYTWLIDILAKHTKSAIYRQGNSFLWEPKASTFAIDTELIQRFLKVYPADSIIMEEGEPATELFILNKGQLEVSVREKILDKVEEPGTIIGETAMLLKQNRTATLKALSDAELIKIPHTQIQLIFEEGKDFFLRMLTTLAQREAFNIRTVGEVNRLLQIYGTDEDSLMERIAQIQVEIEGFGKQSSTLANKYELDWLDRVAINVEEEAAVEMGKRAPIEMVYDWLDPAEQGYILEEGSITYELGGESFEFSGTNMMFGVAELLLSQQLDEPIQRHLRVVKGDSCKIRSVGPKRIIDMASQYHIGWTIAQNIAQVITQVQQIYRKKNAELESIQGSYERVIKTLRVLFAKSLNTVKRYYDEKRYPWLLDLIKKYEKRRTYKKGNLFILDKAATRITVRGEALDPYTRMFKRGDVIVKEHEPARYVYILVSGIIDVLVEHKKIDSETETGAVIGETAMLLGQNRTATLIAADETKVICLDQEQIKTVFETDPQFFYKMLVTLSKREAFNVKAVRELNRIQAKFKEDKLSARNEVSELKTDIINFYEDALELATRYTIDWLTNLVEEIRVEFDTMMEYAKDYDARPSES